MGSTVAHLQLGSLHGAGWRGGVDCFRAVNVQSVGPRREPEIVRIPKYKNCSVQNIFRTDGKTPDVWTVYCICVWDRARTGLGRETRETTTGCLPNFYQENRSIHK